MMESPCKSWWRNCALEADPEILAVDRLEEELAPLDPDVSRIRELISTIELCHHKGERWVWNILEAIGRGETAKGLGTRPPGQLHPAERVWQSACATLSAWCGGCPAAAVSWSVGDAPASRLLAGLGERAPLKEWQVQRVFEKIRCFIRGPLAADHPAAHYVWILLGGGEGDSMYRSRCPEQYKEHEDFWLATVRTLLHDKVDGREAALSLGLAIDMLWPCHWRFLGNLQIVLEAIGGRLRPGQPFAACGRNIGLLPNRDRLEQLCQTLRAFWAGAEPRPEPDRQVLVLLGEPTPAKRWLAASLDKTIRLQLDPPAAVRAMSDLRGPAWISQERVGELGS